MLELVLAELDRSVAPSAGEGEVFSATLQSIGSQSLPTYFSWTMRREVGTFMQVYVVNLALLA